MKVFMTEYPATGKTVRLYPPTKSGGQSFKGVKPVVVPNQSMTLKEIIKRFVRKESLPIEKEGTFVEGLGDLEKMQHEDLAVKHERVANARKVTKKFREEEEKRAKADASPPPPKGGGESPSGSPPPAPSPPPTPPAT